MIDSRAGQPLIDVVMLSYSKTSREYHLTLEAINTLFASEATSTFNAIVVETTSARQLDELSQGYRFGNDVQVLFPGVPFNYNAYLQHAYTRTLRESPRPILITNNDVLFEPGSASHLLQALESFESVSPWCPGYHEHRVPGTEDYVLGLRISVELCGWAMMFRRDVVQRIGFAELFPQDFSFWYQDNYYAFQLKRHGFRHALVRSARVHHLFEQSHSLIDDAERHVLTTGAKQIYHQKTERDNQCRLTLIACRTVDEFDVIVAKGLASVGAQIGDASVELLCLITDRVDGSNKPQQRLTSWAQGTYVAYLQSNVEVDVQKVLAGIDSHPDAEYVPPSCGPVASDVADGGNRSQVRPEGFPESGACYRTSLARQEGRHSDIERTRSSTMDVTDIERSGDHANTCGTAATECHLSLCILSIINRVDTYLPQLLAKLRQQCDAKPVEILVLLDNQRSTIGTKRNMLLKMARGEFVAFIDDDDDVAADYVDSLLNGVRAQPPVDCLVFDAWVTFDGGGGKLCRYGCEFQDEDHTEFYLRQPNHLCCFRRSRVGHIEFEHISWQEDFKWAAAVRPLIRSQLRIPKVLYFYRYNSQSSASGLLNTVVRGDRNPNCQVRSGVPAMAVDAAPNWPIPLPPEAQMRYVDMSHAPVFGFLHVLMAPGWEAIVSGQLQKLQVSGLWERTVRLHVGLLGGSAEDFARFLAIQQLPSAMEKVELLFAHREAHEAELPTLEALRHFAQQQSSECAIYYLHTKGITWPCRRSFDWRTMMEHFLILRYRDCLAKLCVNHVCGVNWITEPTGHFSGNFWWARASYVAQQPPMTNVARVLEAHQFPTRHAGEFWLSWGRLPQVAVLHNSEIDHYYHEYPRSRYTCVHDVTLGPPFEVRSAWRGLENQFQDLLAPVGAIQTVVEIGVEFGFSLFCFASALPQARVIGVDPYEQIPGVDRQRLSELGAQAVCGSAEAEAWVRRHLPAFPNVELMKATSEEFATSFDQLADVVHIDAAHTFADVAHDFELWEPKLRPGGCILFHDILAYPEDVGRFFDALPGHKARLLDGAGLGAWYKPRAIEAVPPTNEVGAGDLSVCLIVRDSATTLPACLESIRPWANEIIVVDTGSRDNTVSVAEHYGARVFFFPWCDDFSAARNESLRHARGRWIFWMDSDDTISAVNGEKLRQLARTAPLHGPLAYIVQVECPDAQGTTDCTVVDHVKLLRNVPGIHFEGRIHEQVLASIRQLGGEVAWTDIAVVHSGSDLSPAGKQRKYDRDLRILRLELEERPTHPFTWFNLGMTYADMTEYEQAIVALQKSLSLAAPGESHVRKAYALLVGCQQQLGQLDEAWKSCQIGLSICPEDLELRFRQAVLCQHRGDLDEAIRLYQQVLSPGRERYLCSMDQSLSGYKARHNLALVYMERERHDQAECLWRQILDERPAYAGAYAGLAECLLRQDKLIEASALAEQWQQREPIRIEGWKMRAQVAVARRQVDEARNILSSAPLTFWEDLTWLKFCAQFYWEHGPRSLALSSLTHLMIQAPHDAATQRNLGTWFEQSSCPQLAVSAYRRAHGLNEPTLQSSIGLIRCLVRAGDLPSAEHELKLTYAQFPNRSEVATLWQELGQVDQAMTGQEPRPRIKEDAIRWPTDY